MLTSIRGVGKTTTARILARGLNYELPRWQRGGPTVDMDQLRPPLQRRSSRATISTSWKSTPPRITASRMCARSPTAVRYAPTSARYKVYIVDEVHMLSSRRLQRLPQDARRAAATCEIHLRDHRDPQSAGDDIVRLPAVRSAAGRGRDACSRISRISAGRRCRRPRMRRWRIARAAEGSVRDALSLLDQAIAHGAGTHARRCATCSASPTAPASSTCSRR